MAMQNTAVVAATLSEHDEAGNTLRTYILSSSAGSKQADAKEKQKKRGIKDVDDDRTSKEMVDMRVDIMVWLFFVYFQSSRIHFLFLFVHHNNN